MSLLLDALKRAEQEKLAKQGERGDKEPERAREARDSAMLASTPASAKSLELAPINSPSAGAPPLSAAERARHDAATAKAVFQAKDAPAAPRSKRGLILFIALAVVVVVVAAAGIYVWLAVQSFTPRATASSRPRPTQLWPRSSDLGVRGEPASSNKAS